MTFLEWYDKSDLLKPKDNMAKEFTLMDLNEAFINGSMPTFSSNIYDNNYLYEKLGLYNCNTMLKFRSGKIEFTNHPTTIGSLICMPLHNPIQYFTFLTASPAYDNYTTLTFEVREQMPHPNPSIEILYIAEEI